MLEKIVSGGQTGADRAALGFAMDHGIPHGGWCPRGRLAEDGTIPDQYRLRETPDADPAQRTEWNVRDSDGTAIFSVTQQLSGGSKYTAELARQLGKPCLHLSRDGDGQAAATKLRAFLLAHEIKTLNVAGPRASHEREVGRFVQEVLRQVLDNGR